MSYTGSKRVGLVSLAFRSIFDSESVVETGTYHFYFCPVCAHKAVYIEKWGVMRPVAVDFA